MRVLVAHNHYQGPAVSGENISVHRDVDLLDAAGHEVCTYYTHSDDIISVADKAAAALGPVYSRSGVAGFRSELRRFRPDVVHVHNLNPLISPAVLNVTNSHRVASVQTLHNYRHGCLNGLHFRDGGVCTECLGRRLKTPGIRHACYRGSRAASLSMASGDLTHHMTWKTVDRFIALTPFMLELATQAGIARERLALRPSFVADPGEPRSAVRSRTIVYAGRLDEAKGVRLLMEAWRRMQTRTGWDLVVAGDGPLSGLVTDIAGARADVQYLGMVQPTRLGEIMHRAALSVIPSVSFEGFPLVAAEAMAHGLPVASCKGTSTASAVPAAAGWPLSPDAEVWSAFFGQLTLNEAQVRGEAARRFYLEALTPEAALKRLESIYRAAIASRQGL